MDEPSKSIGFIVIVSIIVIGILIALIPVFLLIAGLFSNGLNFDTH